MPLRLFGGRGRSRGRACPACEQEIAAEATFCSSCYLVIRPEGAADLRHHLRGGRIPSDVYLLRKLQVEDPDLGPVIRVPGNPPAAPPAAEPLSSPASPPAAPSIAQSVGPSSGQIVPRSETRVPVGPAATKASPSLQARRPPRFKGLSRSGVEALLWFDAPLPPPACSVEETPSLLAWMLERDPVIPNNLELLETIHASVFPEGPATRLGYQQHLLLQIADDLLPCATPESLESHLTLLAAAYRRAAESYRAVAETGREEAKTALWQLSSLASRLRVEAWVFRSRHTAQPKIARTRPPRRRASTASAG